MTTAMLLILGAAGGSLRSLVEVYNSCMDWRVDRRAHRREARSGPSRPRPAFQDYVDAVPDIVAALFHIGLGAAATALLGASGHVTSAYAAIAVGISGPALLAQLGQLQGVRDVVTGQPRVPSTSPGSAAPTAPDGQAPAAPARYDGEQDETAGSRG